ncbi:hypothetical protein ACFQX6_15135 [Streptosporangium lutulentum]
MGLDGGGVVHMDRPDHVPGRETGHRHAWGHPEVTGDGAVTGVDNGVAARTANLAAVPRATAGCGCAALAPDHPARSKDRREARSTVTTEKDAKPSTGGPAAETSGVS